MADDLDSSWVDAPASKSGQAAPSLDDFWQEPKKGDAGKPATAGASDQSVSTLSDVGKSAASGVRSGVEGLLGLPGAVSSGRDWVVQKALEKIGGASPEQAANTTNKWFGWSDMPTASDIHDKFSSWGLPDYTPQTTAGKYARSVGEFVPGIATIPVGGEGIAGDILANTAKYAVAPGVASEAAGQMFQGTPAEPYARTAAGLAGGFGAEAAEQLGRAGVGAAKQFAEPLTAAGRENWAARKFQGIFADPDAAKQALAIAKAKQGPDFIGPQAPSVTGSNPTTGQLTGDMGALSAERDMVTADPAFSKSNPHGTGSEQQNAARTAALEGIQPTGSPEAVGQAVRDRLAQIDAEHEATVTAAQKAAQEASAGIGGTGTPEDIGAKLRAGMQGGRDAAKANERKLWDAVDPNGTLSMHTWDVSGSADAIKSALPATAKPMSGDEAAIFDAASNLPTIAPFNDITALRSRISTEMRAEMRANGQTPAYARLAQLRGSVEDAINSLVEEKTAAENAAVAKGAISPADTIAGRVQSEIEASAAAKSKASGANAVGINPASSGQGTGSVRGAVGTEGQGVGRSGNAAGSEGVSGTGTNGPSAPVAPFVAPTAGAAPGRPQSLLSFIIRKGGVQNQDGELTDLIKQYPGLVNNKRGMTLDEAREAAAEAGYLGHDREEAIASTTPSDFTDALRNGHQVYSSFDEGQLAAVRDHAESRKWLEKVNRHAEDVDNFARRYNLSVDKEHRWTAAELMAEHGMSADDALDRAAMELYNRDAEIARANGEAVYVPGSENGHAGNSGAAGARQGRGQQGEMGGASAALRGAGESGNGAQGRFNPIDEATAQRLKAATAATKDRVKTYDNGVVGQVLKTKGQVGDYKLEDGLVSGKVFSSGPAGAQTIAAYRKAVGPQGEAVLHDAAAQSLTRAAVRDGVLDPAKYEAWARSHQDALRALPDSLKAKFANAASASRALEEAASVRKAAVDQFQKSAVKPFLGLSNPQDVTRTVGGIFEAKDGVKRMTELVSSMKDNPDAQQGLRKAVADYILSKAKGTTESGTSGIANLNAGRFQSLIRGNVQTLKAAGFSDEEISLMRAIGEDMQRSQRTLSATRLPNQSNTAQDLVHSIRAVGEARPLSLLATILTEGAAGFGLGNVHGAIVGGLSGLGTHVIRGMRNAGIGKASELVRDAMFNPELARALLEKTPKNVGVGAYTNLRKALGNMAVFGNETLDRGSRKQRAAGGSVKKKRTHEELVSRLMSASEKAKLETKRDTKAILNVPDDTVAKALAVAQKAI